MRPIFVLFLLLPLHNLLAQENYDDVGMVCHMQDDGPQLCEMPEEPLASYYVEPVADEGNGKKDSETTLSEVKPSETKDVVTAEKPKSKGDTKPKAKPKKSYRPKPLSYRPETCKWVDDLPRKILKAPRQGNCKGETTVCTGYVVCKPTTEGAPMVVRLSTCGPENCSDGGAAECTKQRPYYSLKALGEKKETVSEDLKSKLIDEQKE